MVPHGFLSKSMDVRLPNMTYTTMELSEGFVGFFVVGTWDIIPPLFPVVFERKTKSINAVPGSDSEIHLLLLSTSCGAEGGSR